MKAIGVLLVIVAFFNSGSARAQAGTEYGAGLSLSNALAHKLGQKLSGVVDPGTIHYDSDQSAPNQVPPKSEPIRNPSAQAPQ